MAILQHSTVVFLRDLPQQDVAAGDAGVIVRVHAGSLDIVKARAKAEHVPYQRLMYELIERGLAAK